MGVGRVVGGAFVGCLMTYVLERYLMNSIQMYIAGTDPLLIMVEIVFVSGLVAGLLAASSPGGAVAGFLTQTLPPLFLALEAYIRGGGEFEQYLGVYAGWLLGVFQNPEPVTTTPFIVAIIGGLLGGCITAIRRNFFPLLSWDMGRFKGVIKRPTAKPKRLNLDEETRVILDQQPTHDMDTHQKLKEILETEDKSFDQLLREVMNEVKVNYSKAYQLGYSLGEKECQIWYYCNVCGERINIKPNGENHKAVIEYMNEHGWGHTNCHEKRRRELTVKPLTEDQLEEVSVPPTPSYPMYITCPHCPNKLRYISNVDRWYCDNCQKCFQLHKAR